MMSEFEKGFYAGWRTCVERSDGYPMTEEEWQWVKDNIETIQYD